MGKSQNPHPVAQTATRMGHPSLNLNHIRGRVGFDFRNAV